MTKEEFSKLSNPEKREARKEAFGVLKDLLKDSDEGTEMLKILRPTLFGLSSQGRTGGEPKWLTFGNLFEKKGSQVDELKLFQEMKVGRHECRILIKDNIRKAEPVNRKWIDFDPETGMYTLIKIGEKAPQDWVGYQPMEQLSADEVSLI
jgi:hypothetical protein